MNCPCCNREMIEVDPFGTLHCPVGGNVGLSGWTITYSLGAGTITTVPDWFKVWVKSLRCYPPEVIWVSNKTNKAH